VNGEVEMARGRKTGGRKPGSLNKSTLIGKSVQETFRNWLGFDDESVARTGIISQEGYRARTRLKEMIDGDRTPDPAWTNLLKVVMSYGYGVPGKMADSTKKRESLVFVSTSGLLPWDERMDNMKPMTDRMIAQKAEEEKLQLEAAKKPAEPIEAAADNDSEAPVEALELVEPPPSPDNFNRGRGR
jgi:hypothetical protein